MWRVTLLQVVETDDVWSSFPPPPFTHPHLPDKETNPWNLDYPSLKRSGGKLLLILIIWLTPGNQGIASYVFLIKGGQISLSPACSFRLAPTKYNFFAIMLQPNASLIRLIQSSPPKTKEKSPVVALFRSIAKTPSCFFIIFSVIFILLTERLKIEKG